MHIVYIFCFTYRSPPMEVPHCNPDCIFIYLYFFKEKEGQVEFDFCGNLHYAVD